VGGAGTERICEHVHIWELKQAEGEEMQWVEVEKMPHQYFRFFFKEKTASDMKCAGHGDLIYFYKDSHTQVPSSSITIFDIFILLFWRAENDLELYQYW